MSSAAIVIGALRVKLNCTLPSTAFGAVYKSVDNNYLIVF